MVRQLDNDCGKPKKRKLHVL